MPPKIDLKKKQFILDSTSKKTGKTKGGMFAPGAFANLGAAMLDPRGAAAPPQETDEDLEELIEAVRTMPPPPAGGGLPYRNF